MAGTIVADTIQDGAGNSTSMDNAIYGSAKAWVRFNGISGVTVNASYNVSSVTRAATGNYTMNFSNAFVDTNYSVAGTAGYNDATSMGTVNPKTFNTTSLQFVTDPANGNLSDYHYISVQIWR